METCGTGWIGSQPSSLAFPGDQFQADNQEEGGLGQSWKAGCEEWGEMKAVYLLFTENRIWMHADPL